MTAHGADASTQQAVNRRTVHDYLTAKSFSFDIWNHTTGDVESATISAYVEPPADGVELGFAANTRYLLCAIDRSNQRLNEYIGSPVSNHCATSSHAPNAGATGVNPAVNAWTVKDAIDRLVNVAICGAGRRLNSNACADCAAGSFMSLTNHRSTQCMPCPCGHTCPSSGMSAAGLACPTRTASAAGSTSCTDCDLFIWRTWNSSTGNCLCQNTQTLCPHCPNGLYCPWWEGPWHKNPTSCPAGMYAVNSFEPEKPAEDPAQCKNCTHGIICPGVVDSHQACLDASRRDSGGTLRGTTAEQAEIVSRRILMEDGTTKFFCNPSVCPNGWYGRIQGWGFDSSDTVNVLNETTLSSVASTTKGTNLSNSCAPCPPGFPNSRGRGASHWNSPDNPTQGHQLNRRGGDEQPHNIFHCWGKLSDRCGAGAAGKRIITYSNVDGSLILSGGRPTPTCLDLLHSGNDGGSQAHTKYSLADVVIRFSNDSQNDGTISCPNVPSHWTSLQNNSGKFRPWVQGCANSANCCRVRASQWFSQCPNGEGYAVYRFNAAGNVTFNNGQPTTDGIHSVNYNTWDGWEIEGSVICTKICGAGEYLESGNCLKCPENTFQWRIRNDAGIESCAPCPGGCAQNNTGSTICYRTFNGAPCNSEWDLNWDLRL